MTTVDEFGPDLHLTPRWYRPYWLSADENIRWSCNGRPYVDARAGEVRQWGDTDNRVSIRLRADHPHYRNIPATEVPANPQAPLPPELQQRMVALVHVVANRDRSSSFLHGRYSNEARAIVADPGFPAEVDGDLVEARDLVVQQPEHAHLADTIQSGRFDHITSVRVALAAFRRGKQMAR